MTFSISTLYQHPCSYHIIHMSSCIIQTLAKSNVCIFSTHRLPRAVYSPLHLQHYDGGVYLRAWDGLPRPVAVQPPGPPAVDRGPARRHPATPAHPAVDRVPVLVVDVDGRCRSRSGARLSRLWPQHVCHVVARSRATVKYILVCNLPAGL